MKSIALLITLVLSVPALAQWTENGTPIPDEAWRKSVGTFGAMLLLSDKPEEFMADWEKPEAPTMSTTDVAERGKPIVAFVLFVGCKEVSGVCNSTVDFTVLRPDGSEYASHKDAELWKDKPGPAEGQIQLSLGNLGVVIEPEDPSGEYTIKAKVYDLNARRNVEIEQRFSVK